MQDTRGINLIFIAGSGWTLILSAQHLEDLQKQVMQDGHLPDLAKYLTRPRIHTPFLHLNFRIKYVSFKEVPWSVMVSSEDFPSIQSSKEHNFNTNFSVEEKYLTHFHLFHFFFLLPTINKPSWKF